MRSLLLSLAAVALLASPARARESFEEAVHGPRLEIAGTFGGGGDDFVRRGGGGLRVSFLPIRFVGAELLMFAMPELGPASYTQRLNVFRFAAEVAPDISPETGLFTGSVLLVPLLGRVTFPDGARGELGLHLGLGGGMVATVDDVDLVQHVCAQYAPAEQRGRQDEGCHVVRQVHPVLSFTAGIRLVLPPGMVIRFDVSRHLHPEQFPGFDGVVRDIEKRWLTLAVGTIGGSIPLLRGP